MRAAVVILEDGRIALIERARDGRTYFVFPGSGVETGESPEEAAVREASEELGGSVELGAPVYDSRRDGHAQRYYAARVAGGTFGIGWGMEMTTSGTTAKGTYTLAWMNVADLTKYGAGPRALSESLSRLI